MGSICNCLTKPDGSGNQDHKGEIVFEGADHTILVAQKAKESQSPPTDIRENDIVKLQSVVRGYLQRKENAVFTAPLIELEEISDPEEVQPVGPTSEDKKAALSPIAAAKVQKLPAFVYNEGRVPCETKGPMKLSDGSVYIGGWKNLKRYGEGCCYTSDGSYMEGYWSNGLHFKGRTIHANGEVYEGGYSHGKRQGKGRMEDATGKVKYEGDWFEGYMHGHGHLISEGRDYEGNFERGIKKGKGVMRWSGNTYDGDFVNNQMHGVGLFTQSNGQQGTYTFAYDKRLSALHLSS